MFNENLIHYTIATPKYTTFERNEAHAAIWLTLKGHYKTWTLDWIVDWTLVSIIDSITRISIARGKAFVCRLQNLLTK